MTRRSFQSADAALALTVLLTVSVLFVPAANASHDIVRDGMVIHWGRNNPPTAVAQAYMADHTGARWPVSASAVTWNQSAFIGVYWTAPADCPFHCVHVWADNYGPVWYGRALLAWNSDGHLIGGVNGTTIQLNKYYSKATTRDRHVTCQEMGHTIGLDHTGPESSSCMNDDVLNTTTPNGHDWSMLESIYNH
jgi:hypothetical protein